MPAAPTLDGHATGQFSSTNSGTVTLTTSNTNDIIVVLICNGTTTSSTVAVSSVTASGLSFTNRSQTLDTIRGTGYGYEVWWALASGALISKVITVTLASSIDDAALMAFGVNGANTSAPWDTNGSLTAVTTNPSGSAGLPLAPTFSTSQADDFIFVAGCFTRTNANLTSWTSSWTALDFINNGGATNFAGIGANYEGVTSTQSGVTASFSVNSVSFNAIIVDAITANSSGTNVNLVAASATGAAAAFLNQLQNVSLVAATASGTAAAMAGAGPPLAAVSATGAVEPFSVSIGASVPLIAVAATGVAIPYFPILDFVTVPLITILNNKPIAVAGAIGNSPVPMMATLPHQLPLAVIANKYPIPLSGQMTSAPIPMEGTVP